MRICPTCRGEGKLPEIAAKSEACKAGRHHGCRWTQCKCDCPHVNKPKWAFSLIGQPALERPL